MIALELEILSLLELKLKLNLSLTFKTFNLTTKFVGFRTARTEQEARETKV